MLPPSLIPDPELDPEPDPPLVLPEPELGLDAPEVMPEPDAEAAPEVEPDTEPAPDDLEFVPLDVVPSLEECEPEPPAPSEEEQAARNAKKVNAKLREWLSTDTFFPRRPGAEVGAP
jgi:hypothetical protein